MASSGTELAAYRAVGTLYNALMTALVLGLVILTMQPTGLLSVIGILVGISFLFSGVDLLVFSAGFHGPEKDSEQATPS